MALAYTTAQLTVAPGYWRTFLSQVSPGPAVWWRNRVSAPHVPLKLATPTAEPLTLYPSRPADHLDLHIAVSDDTRTLTLSRIDPAWSTEACANVVDHLEHLATLPSCGLMYPDVFLARSGTIDTDTASRLTMLYNRQRRMTTYRGVTVGWDASVDQRVWTTNIDTVVLLNNLGALGVFDDAALRSVVEVGTGGGHIAATCAARMPGVRRITITDIVLPALRCALRNINEYRRDDMAVDAILGKGIGSLDGRHDLLVVNPPYIPVHPAQRALDGDPYRGTGLVREIVEDGCTYAARILMAMSSLGWGDLQSYAAEYGRSLVVRSERQAVPLKIEHVDPTWARWLVEQGALQERDPQQHFYRYWHEIFLVEVLP